METVGDLVLVPLLVWFFPLSSRVNPKVMQSGAGSLYSACTSERPAEDTSDFLTPVHRWCNTSSPHYLWTCRVWHQNWKVSAQWFILSTVHTRFSFLPFYSCVVYLKSLKTQSHAALVFNLLTNLIINVQISLKLAVQPTGSPELPQLGAVCTEVTEEAEITRL